MGLSTEAAEEIGRETCHILRKTRTQKNNSSKAERDALLAFKKYEDLVILPADKGNATVVMNTVDYSKKMKELLNEPAYKILHKDPTSKIERKTATLIRKSGIPDDIIKKIIPTASVPPRL
jgi:hypothetical protein